MRCQAYQQGHHLCLAGITRAVRLALRRKVQNQSKAANHGSGLFHVKNGASIDWNAPARGLRADGSSRITMFQASQRLVDVTVVIVWPMMMMDEGANMLEILCKTIV